MKKTLIPILLSTLLSFSHAAETLSIDDLTGEPSCGGSNVFVPISLAGFGTATVGGLSAIFGKALSSKILFNYGALFTTVGAVIGPSGASSYFIHSSADNEDQLKVKDLIVGIDNGLIALGEGGIYADLVWLYETEEEISLYERAERFSHLLKRARGVGYNKNIDELDFYFESLAFQADCKNHLGIDNNERNRLIFANVVAIFAR